MNGKYTEINGNLFDSLEPCVITHVVNNQFAWGSGFVIPLGQRFPIARNMYFQQKELNWEKEKYLGHAAICDVGEQIYVSNMFAQTLGGQRPLNYRHLVSCMNQTCNFISNSFPKMKILAPKFGAGLAGGDWSIIRELVEDCWIKEGIDVTIFDYKPKHS